MSNKNRSNPIDLSIENQFREQATPVIYIVSEAKEGTDDQRILFRIKNVGTNNYKLYVPSKAAGPDNYHFAFVFRPGTLRYKKKEEIQTKFKAACKGDWKVSPLITRQQDKAEIIYLVANKVLTLGLDNEFLFMVNDISGEPGTGSRSSQVQLMYSIPFEGDIVSGTRNKHIDIINHDGKTFAPLEFAVLGNPTLVHRTFDNTIRLQMVESHGKHIMVSDKTFIDVRFPRYDVSYDPNYHPAWVMGKSDTVNKIEYVKDDHESTIVKVDGGENDIVFDNYKSWGYKTIRLKFTKKEEINNLILRFDHVPADGPIGLASIKISVRNLPGFWDTDFEVTLEKTVVTSEFDKTENKNFGMLHKQVFVGHDLAGNEHKAARAKALESAMNITSHETSAEAWEKIHMLLQLVDDRIGMNGLHIDVGDVKGLTGDDLEKIKKSGYLIKADQWGEKEVRFKVDFDGNIEGNGGISVKEDIEGKNLEVTPVMDPQTHKFKGGKIEGRSIIGEELYLGLNKSEIEDILKKWELEGVKIEDQRGIYFLPDHAAEKDYALLRFHTRHGKAHNFEILVGDNEGDHIIMDSKMGKIAIGDQALDLVHNLEKIQLGADTKVHGRIKDKDGYVMPIGSIIAYGGAVIPAGWLECNGQSIKGKTEYQKLIDVLPGGHKDNVPDLRSRFIIGAGPKSTGAANDNRRDERKELLDGYAFYEKGGKQKHKLETTELPSHTHSINNGNMYHHGRSFKGDNDHQIPYVAIDETEKDHHNHVEGTDPTGGGQAHDNIPPYYALRYIIKH